MRGITRAAGYLPAGSIDGRRVAAADEDGFTMVTSALERMEDAGPGSTSVGRLLLAGDLPRTAESDLARFLGSRVLTDRFNAGKPGLLSALRAAKDPVRGAEAVLVVAADLSEEVTAPRDTGRSSHSDGAVALRVEESAGPPAERDPESFPGDAGSAIAPLFRLAHQRRGEEPGTWTGDWDPSSGPTRSIGLPRSPRPSLPTDGPVSQGAYVPRPRYIENLPSRWRFAGEKCSSCGTLTFPVRGRCRQCGVREGLETVRLPRDGGEVVASTVIGPGGQPTEFDEQVEYSGPYGVVLVEIAPGVRVTLQVTDARPGEVGIGARVATRLRRLYPMEGEWRYGRKAIPLA